MKTNTKKNPVAGCIFILAFAVWTVLIKTVDVQPAGVNNTDIGFAAVNTGFHRLTGVNMTLYCVTDWLGLVPVIICMAFGFTGFCQLVKRKSLFKVDADILISGIYYAAVILCYLIFEAFPVNYRPILINNNMEASYPSSTTLLVMCVMPTLGFYAKRKFKSKSIKGIINTASILFSVFMVWGRLVSGVHWLTDIVGSFLLSTGLYLIYKGAVMLAYGRDEYGF